MQTAIQDEIERLLRDGVSQDELDKAKQGYLQSQQVRRTNDGQLAGMLNDLSQAGRTMDFYAKLEKDISALTPEQVLASAKKHIEPSHMVIVKAGDFEAKATGKQ